jgi:hypothetical protein
LCCIVFMTNEMPSEVLPQAHRPLALCQKYFFTSGIPQAYPLVISFRNDTPI